MKYILAFGLGIGLLAAAAVPAQATDVGVSIGISQPGVYGRIDIGRFPQPAVVVAQPVWVQPPRHVVVQPEPVYMWVPPGHRKQWHRHCGRYGACGAPVVFVQDRWYRDNVRLHATPIRDDRGPGRGHGRGHDGRFDDREQGPRGHGRGSDRRHD